MKYLYQYKTRDNERREGEISAASREAVYQLLKKDGIKPFKVDLAPGLWNRMQSIGKRWFAIVILALALVVTLCAYLASERKVVVPTFEAEQTRRQVIGDTAIIEKGIRTGWADVFEKEGDRFLASFAIPGVKAGQRNTTVEQILAAMNESVPVAEEDGIEARQMKAMVEGMKRELRAYVANGGYIVQYGKRLTERQDAEIALYERTKTEIETAAKSLPQKQLEELWERRNNALRQMGVKLVPMPE